MRSRRERNLERLSEMLDRIIEKLDELPKVFAAEEELAKHFDLSEPDTKNEVFQKTVSLLGTIKTTALIAQTVLIQTSLSQPSIDSSASKSKKYSATVSIACLPQENGRWVATAYMGFAESVLAYGDTQKQSIAAALRALAKILDSEEN
jgi:hypothetical protein